MVGSGSEKKVRIRPDLDPQHCNCMYEYVDKYLYTTSFDFGLMLGTGCTIINHSTFILSSLFLLIPYVLLKFASSTGNISFAVINTDLCALFVLQKMAQ